MTNEIDTFTRYLAHQGRSQNTVDSYRLDLETCTAYFQTVGINQWATVDRYAIMNLITHLQKQGRANTTINRFLSSLRQLYRFLIQEGLVKTNPLTLIHQLPVQIDQQSSQTVLKNDEVQALLQAPDTSHPLGLRDRALLEMFYATGMKVTEILQLSMDQLHLDLRVVNFQGDHGRARIIPLSPTCCTWLSKYLTVSRPQLVSDQEPFVFVNAHGHHLTRQGIWKILRQQTNAANLKRDVTPQLLRHTFVADLLTNGASWQGVQSLLGHTPTNTAYAQLLTLSSQELIDLYDRYHTDI